MAQIPTEAPNFTGEYPGQGQMIGPAWRAAWALLRSGDELSASRLAEAMCAASPIMEQTARNLLSQARKSGVLDVRYAVAKGRRKRNPHYRVGQRYGGQQR